MISRYFSWVRNLSGPAAWLFPGAIFTVGIFIAQLVFDHEPASRTVVHSLIAGAAWTLAMFIIIGVILPAISRRRPDRTRPDG